MPEQWCTGVAGLPLGGVYPLPLKGVIEQLPLHVTYVCKAITLLHLTQAATTTPLLGLQTSTAQMHIKDA
jgi:hypothetical protein